MIDSKKSIYFNKKMYNFERDQSFFFLICYKDDFFTTKINLNY